MNDQLPVTSHNQVLTIAQRLRESRWVRLSLAAWHSFQQDNCTQMAAAISYFAMLSAFPLVLLLITLLPAMIRPFAPGYNANMSLVRFAQFAISPEAGAWLRDILPRLQQSRGAAEGVGLLALIWTASNVFGQINLSFNRIWRIHENQEGNANVRAMATSLVRDRLNSLLLLVLVTFIFLFNNLLGVATTLLRHEISPSPYRQLLLMVVNIVTSTGLSALALAMLYRYLAPIRVPWRVVWPGALLAAILNELVKNLVSLFIAGSVAAAYRGVSGPLAIMVWVFLISQNVLLGCELTRHRMLMCRASADTQTTAPLPVEVQP